MASGTVLFIPPSGGITTQAGQGVPGIVIQPTGMTPYVQYGGQPNAQVQAMEKFRKAEAKTLGAIQILIGLIHIGFGVLQLVATRYSYFIPLAVFGGYPFWGGVFFIASGSLCVSAEKNPTSYLVRCSVGLNITSAVMASVGIFLYIAELVSNNGYCGNFYPPDTFYLSMHLNIGLSIMMLLFSTLEFCITVSSAYFGYQAVGCNSNPPAVVYVPYAATGEGVAPSEGTAAPPPAYTPKAE